jgi:toxin FitB
MILLDTVVLSELRKNKPSLKVVSYLEQFSPQDVYLSVMTIGEIQIGIGRVESQNSVFAAQLSAWLKIIEKQFNDNILPVTNEIAKVWGDISVNIGNANLDNLIAATALHHNLTVVTRNMKHFAPLGVRCFNPF